jgi:hypothetical protein
MKAAWEKVPCDAIKNCLLHTGILPKILIENMKIETENALFIVHDDDISLEMRKDIEAAMGEEGENKGFLDNDTTALIHDGNDDVDDMEEADDVIPVNEETTLVSSLGYVTSNFVVTNNKDLKIRKDMAHLYLGYKKKP